MKKSLILLLAIFSVVIAYGQDPVNLFEREITIGKRTLTVWEVSVGNNPETVRKSFIKYCKENLKTKVKSVGKNRMIAEKVDIPIIIDKTGDLRAMSYQNGQASKIAVGFTIGYDLSLNSRNYPIEMARLKEFVRRYVIYHESQYFLEILDENQSRLDELIKNLKNDQKEIKGLTRRIKKIDKTVSKEKNPNKKFDLSNQNIANRARIQAMNDIIVNLKIEIVKINSVVEKSKGSLQRLESQTYEDQ